MDYDNNSIYNNYSIDDEEQLKLIAINMSKCLEELKKIKESSDFEWNECTKYLSEDVNININDIKDNNGKKFVKGTDDLESYILKLESIIQIMKETEIEIKASSKKFESVFDEVKPSMFGVLQNDSVDK